MTTRADRRPRRASALRVGDFVHSGLVPMRVTGWDNGLLVGVTARGGTVRVSHPPRLPLDVTRLVDDDLEVPRMTDTPPLAFIALNATGPSCEFNEIWELSVRLTVPGGRDMESHWQFPVINLPRASARALQVTGFYDRYKRPAEPLDLDLELDTGRPASFDHIARALARHLVDAHPVSLNPDAELPHLATLLRRHNQPAAWAQTVPLTALAAGRAYGAGATPGPPPWDPARLAPAILPAEVEVDDVTAPGRLALTIALWTAVTAPPPPPPAAEHREQRQADQLVAP